MKQVWMVVLLALVLATGAAASENIAGVKIGLYNPEATDGGLLLSGLAGVEIDERIEVYGSLDYYRKKFEETTVITSENPNGGPDITTEVSDFESSVTMLPLMANVRFKIPMGDALDVPLMPYLQGGLGYVLTWYGYDNYVTEDSENQFYGGLGLRLGIGAMYQIGSSSRLTVEIMYQSSSLERSEEDPEIGRPVVSELDMSGIGITIGLQFGGGELH